MTSVAPIRVGIIGLSASPGGWASTAHLPFLHNTTLYEIVALANSSIASAQAAIKAYSLPAATTKAYGSPEDLAADPNVDLVVVSVSVADHYQLIKPALEHSKMSYVEWPFARNLREAEELTSLAKQKGVRTVVGLQGRYAPEVVAITKLIKDGEIGRVLSSTIVADFSNAVISDVGHVGDVGERESGARVLLKYKYFVDSNVGGNIVTVYFGHFIDSVTQVLGEFEEFTSCLGNQYPIVDVVDNNGEVVEAGLKKDTHDEILMQGKLVSGGLSSMHLRAGTPFKGTPGLRWRIVGEKGEILITASGPNFNVRASEMVIQVYDKAADTVKEVKLPEETKGELNVTARNIARLYEGFANSDGRYATFEGALVKHRLIDALFKTTEQGQSVRYDTKV